MSLCCRTVTFCCNNLEAKSKPFYFSLQRYDRKATTHQRKTDLLTPWSQWEASLRLPLLVLGKSQTNLLIIQPTSPSGRVSKFCECVSELLVEHVPQGPRDSLPSQDQDDNDSILAVMASTMSHQAQQFLLHIVPPDDLECKQRCWLATQRTLLLFLQQAGLPPWTRQLG